MHILNLVSAAFEHVNMPESEFEVMITPQPHADPSMRKHHLSVKRLMMPGQRLVIEFEYEAATNFVVDVFAETNTLFRGQQFRRFFEVFTRPEIITFS
jgi:hypothetical protein